MASATVNERYNRNPLVARHETKLTITDGDTFLSDLSSVKEAFLIVDGAIDGATSIAISGRTLTFTNPGWVDQEALLVELGYK